MKAKKGWRRAQEGQERGRDGERVEVGEIE